MINRIKIVPVIIAIILVIVGISGTVKGFTSATTTTTQQPVTLLNYEQDGTFDYQATMAPSYFYGTNQPTIPSSPNIPIQDISSIGMTYQYNSPDDQVQVEIDAVLVAPNSWQKTVVIVPQETEKGNFSINFSVDLTSLTNTAGTIEKELGGVGYSPVNINVVAVVTGTNDVFMHSLAITENQTFLSIGNNLVQTQGSSAGIFGYSVVLSDNSLYGATTIISPQLTIDTTPLVLGPNDTILIKLINGLDFTYAYTVTSDQPIKPSEAVEIDAIVSNPGKWTKTFVLVPSTIENGNFTLNFPVDLAQYAILFNQIQMETGLSATAYNFTIQANVDLTSQTSTGTINKKFTDSIMTDLTGGTLSWTGDLQQADKGTISSTTNVQSPVKIWRIQATTFRMISIIILVIGLALLAFLFLVPAKKVDEQTISKQKALETEQKYKNLIITVNKLPELGLGESILTVDSLDELIKVAQALMKPINHFVNERTDIYWITDARTRYEYLVVGESPSVTEGNEGS